MTQQASAAFRFTFLHGVRIRSGTNYLGKVIGCNPHLQLVPPNTTTEEFPVLRVMDSWEKAFAEFLSRYKGSRSDYEFRRFLPHLGSAWLSYLVENFSLQPGHVFLKDPSVRYIDKFFDVFPEASSSSWSVTAGITWPPRSRRAWRSAPTAPSSNSPGGG